MTLQELLAYQAKRLEHLTHWQDTAIARFEPPASSTSAGSSAPAESEPFSAAIDANTERHAAMAQHLLRVTARHERRVLEAVAQRASSTTAASPADPASPGHALPSGDSP